MSLTIALLGVAAACITAKTDLLPGEPGICFTAEEAQGLLAAPLLGPDGATPVTVTMRAPTEAGETETVAGCPRYLALLTDGWAPVAEAETAALNVQRICDVRAMVAAARAPQTDHLNPPGTDLKDPAQLPASLLQGRDSEDPAGTTIADLVARGEAEILADPAVDLRVTYSFGTASFREFARGDFNQDGTADLLVETTIQPAEGETPYGFVLGLSRFEALGLLISMDSFAE